LPQQGYAVGRDAFQNFLMKHDLRLEKFSSSTRVVYNKRLKNSILWYVFFDNVSSSFLITSFYL
jgi:hypothetical protein